MQMKRGLATAFKLIKYGDIHTDVRGLEWHWQMKWMIC